MNTENCMEPERSACVGALLVQKFAPERVTPDATFEYELVVTNAADRTVESLVLVESLLSVFSIEDSSPPTQGDDPHMGRWLLGPIGPQSKLTVRIRCSTRKTLRFRSHTSISYSVES